jgi:hypothetical protein
MARLWSQIAGFDRDVLGGDALAVPVSQPIDCLADVARGIAMWSKVPSHSS